LFSNAFDDFWTRHKENNYIGSHMALR
jgi:hypothetical protein